MTVYALEKNPEMLNHHISNKNDTNQAFHYLCLLTEKCKEKNIIIYFDLYSHYLNLLAGFEWEREKKTSWFLPFEQMKNIKYITTT